MTVLYSRFYVNLITCNNKSTFSKITNTTLIDNGHDFKGMNFCLRVAILIETSGQNVGVLACDRNCGRVA